MNRLDVYEIIFNGEFFSAVKFCTKTKEFRLGDDIILGESLLFRREEKQRSESV
jgi:hypothetical protein